MPTTIRGLFNGLWLYGHILLEAKSPGEIIWSLFGQTKGKLPIFGRDLVCDWQTMLSLTRTARSTDEKTTAFDPFVPQFKLNDDRWNARRRALRRAFDTSYTSRVVGGYDPIMLGTGLVDVYDPVFAACFEVGFNYVFGRPPDSQERNLILPGLVDLNRYIKRQVLHPDRTARETCHRAFAQLIDSPPPGFIFAGCEDFYAMTEEDRVSAVGSDLIFSCSVQPADLVCHMLVLRFAHPADFERYSLEDCMNETLRLFPLSDIYARLPYRNDRGWVASLVQLNRNGWETPDEFRPARWREPGHPPNMAWGVEARKCPASDIGLSMAKGIFEAIVHFPGLSISFPANFKHERTFPFGLPANVNYGGTVQRPFGQRISIYRHFLRWIIERKRMIEQREIW